jgi:PadR family transcriptional regulator, regulatory protein PadR
MAHFLGTTEYMILLAIVRLEGGAYGAAILDELERAVGRAPSSGALSTALDRLETKGLVTSSYEEGAPSRGGRPRRVTTLTPTGWTELSSTVEAFRRLRSGLPDAPDSLLADES